MAPEIAILDEQSFVKVGKKVLLKLIRATLGAEKAAAKSVTVLLTDNARVRRLNARYLGHNRNTDVIAFGTRRSGDHQDRRGVPRSGERGRYLGDVVVSAEMACDRAAEFGVTPKEELKRYVAHGLLHLLGYRDHTRKDSCRMHARQEQILKLFNA